MATKLEVNRETCGRTGMCIMRFPQYFKEDDEGFPLVTLEAGVVLSAAEIAEIIDVCPTGSIVTVQESPSKQDPPQ